jgi:hypothetical protein
MREYKPFEKNLEGSFHEKGGGVLGQQKERILFHGTPDWPRMAILLWR